MASFTPLQGRPFTLAVREASRLRHLDPLAVMANALHEGIEGHIGANGTEYGPWQVSPPPLFFPPDPRAGPLPHYDQDVQDWAWSHAGVNYVLGELADHGARGLTGPAAVRRMGQYLNGGQLDAAELRARVATYRNLKARGDGAWPYLNGVAGGPTTPAAPAPVDRPTTTPPAPHKANAAWQHLLHVYARTAPRRCQEVIRIANRLPREHHATTRAARSLASAGGAGPGDVITLDDVEEFNE